MACDGCGLGTRDGRGGRGGSEEGRDERRVGEGGSGDLLSSSKEGNGILIESVKEGEDDEENEKSLSILEVSIVIVSIATVAPFPSA